MAKRHRKRSSTASTATEVVSLVLAGTRARHGGTNALRIINTTERVRTKKQLSADYRPTKPVNRGGGPADPPLAESRRRLLTTSAGVPDDPAALLARAVEAVEHLGRCGDWRKITKLVLDARTDRRRGQLIRWFSQFGAFASHAKEVRFKARSDLTRPEFEALLRVKIFELPAGGATRRGSR